MARFPLNPELDLPEGHIGLFLNRPEGEIGGFGPNVVTAKVRHKDCEIRLSFPILEVVEPDIGAFPWRVLLPETFFELPSGTVLPGKITSYLHWQLWDAYQTRLKTNPHI